MSKEQLAERNWFCHLTSMSFIAIIAICQPDRLIVLRRILLVGWGLGMTALLIYMWVFWMGTPWSRPRVEVLREMDGWK